MRLFERLLRFGVAMTLLWGLTGGRRGGAALKARERAGKR